MGGETKSGDNRVWVSGVGWEWGSGWGSGGGGGCGGRVGMGSGGGGGGGGAVHTLMPRAAPSSLSGSPR